jgi:glycerophosphoryl diester phosphodiesterase
MKASITIILMSVAVFVTAQNFFIAHRGASYDAPENTLAAANLAWKTGADAVEVDVYLTADHRVVVIHDKNTKRTCGGEDFVIQDTFSEILRKLDAGSWKNAAFKGEKIPFLEEVIATVPRGKKLVVEIKCGSEIIPYLEPIMAKTRKKSRIIFISFDWDAIVKTKKAFPDNKSYWLSGDKKIAMQKLPEVKDAGLEGINMQYAAIDAELVAKARQHQLEVLAWTVDQPEEAKRLIHLGVTHLTTNRPAWLKKQLTLK